MTLENLVTEWRDAREAILLVNWGDPAVAKSHIHLWTRLGHAEAALMAHARIIEPLRDHRPFIVSEAYRTDPDAAP